jgi:hypothetical protein
MESDRESKALVAVESSPLKRAGMLVPRIIADAGDKAARRFLEFFAATIRNKNARQAYYHATVRFFEWCDRHKIGEIADVEPLHVAAYIEALSARILKSRRLNSTSPPSACCSTGSSKHVVKTGKTTVLTT